MIEGRLFSHIDVAVPDIARARPVWDALMNVLGAEAIVRADASVRYVIRDRSGIRAEFVVLHPGRRPRASGCRIAFAAESIDVVDRAAEAVRRNGAQEIEGPAFHAEYDPSFYAVYFEDGCGIALEVCHHRIMS